eukprot:scaffold1903_cov63-Phaeocystis_antarctica.AAC.2
MEIRSRLLRRDAALRALGPDRPEEQLAPLARVDGDAAGRAPRLVQLQVVSWTSRNTQPDGLGEIVTAARNIAAIECVARAHAGEVVGTNQRDVNMDGARGSTDREEAVEVQASRGLPGDCCVLPHLFTPHRQRALALVVAAAAARASVSKPGIADDFIPGIERQHGVVNLEVVVGEGGRDVENCENSEGGGSDAEHHGILRPASGETECVRAGGGGRGDAQYSVCAPSVCARAARGVSVRGMAAGCGLRGSAAAAVWKTMWVHLELRR